MPSGLAVYGERRFTCTKQHRNRPSSNYPSLCLPFLYPACTVPDSDLTKKKRKHPNHGQQHHRSSHNSSLESEYSGVLHSFDNLAALLLHWPLVFGPTFKNPGLASGVRYADHHQHRVWGTRPGYVPVPLTSWAASPKPPIAWESARAQPLCSG